eukprot:4592314-Pyramimonas_sp.AAC.1
MFSTRHPSAVFSRFLGAWATPFGAPRRAVYDGGGEFGRTCSQELEDMGCHLMATSAATPQQSATVVRRGGQWISTLASKLIDQFSIRFDQPAATHKIQWLLASVCWAMNSSVNAGGYSPAQRVLGRGLRLPHCLLDNVGRLSLHERTVSDKPLSER